MSLKKILLIGGMITGLVLAGCTKDGQENVVIKEGNNFLLPLNETRGNGEQMDNQLTLDKAIALPTKQSWNCFFKKDTVICDGTNSETIDIKTLKNVLSGWSFGVKHLSILSDEETIKALPFNSNFLFEKEPKTDSGNFLFTSFPQVLFTRQAGQITSNIYPRNPYVEDNTLIIIDDVRPNWPFSGLQIGTSGTENKRAINDFYAIELQGKYASNKREIYGNKSEYIPANTTFSLYTNSEEKNVKFFLSQGDKQEEIPYTQEGTKLTPTTKNVEKNNEYTLIAQIEKKGYTYEYAFRFNTISFAIKENKQLNYQEKPSNNIQLCTTHQLDTQILQEQLNADLGTGKSIIYNGFELGPDFDDNESAYREDNCYLISYFLDPKGEKSSSLTIRNNYGEPLPLTLDRRPFSINEKNTNDRFVKLGTTPITILPTNKQAQNISIVSKNIPQTTLFVRSCSLSTDPAIIEKNFSESTIYGPKDNDTYLLNRFLTCKETKNYTLKSKNFSWWTPIQHNLNIEKFLSGGDSVVEISQEKNKRGQTYILSDIGIIGKYTNNGHILHTRTNNMTTGKPYTTLLYTLGIRENGKRTISTGEMTAYQSFKFQDDPELGFLYLTTQDTGNQQSNIFFFPRSGIENNERQGGTQRYSYIENNFSIPSYEIGGNEYSDDPYSIYAYTDRALYKPNKTERIEISGRVRTKLKSKTPKGTLHILVTNPVGQEVYQETIKKLDEYGGFSTHFMLAEESKLGNYTINYEFSYTNNNTVQPLQFSSFFQVQEYKKSPISLGQKRESDEKGNPILSLQPKYYFGTAIKNYTINFTYTAKQSNQETYDWQCEFQRCSDPRYYESTTQSWASGGNIVLRNKEEKDIHFKLPLTIKKTTQFEGTLTLVDNQTQEVKETVINQTFSPAKKIGLKGRSYNRQMADNEKGTSTYKVEGILKLLDKESEDKYTAAKMPEDITIDLYQRDDTTSQEQGPDGERYYKYGMAYKHISTEKIQTNDEGLFVKNISLPTTGTFLIKVSTHDGFENTKEIGVSDRSEEALYEGKIPNNYVLSIYTKNKEYREGETLEINREPRIPGATAIITIEKEGEILLNKTITVTKEPLKLSVQKKRFPNARVSVAQIVPAHINNKINPHTENARALFGYKNVTLQPSEMKLAMNIEVTNSKGEEQKYYKPGETVLIKVKSTSIKGSPLQSRISIGILDKAAIDLYDQIKKPLETFYTITNPGFRFFTNYQLIYRTLKVFTHLGEKGGGGDDGGQGFLQALLPRKKFLDIAFWNGGMTTDKQGSLSFKVTLPDNLTTRVVEAIGVSKEGHMGSQRVYFTSNQETQIIANLPRFLEAGTSIKIPVSLITQDTKKEYHLQGQIHLGNTGYKLNLEKDPTKPNSYTTTLDIANYGITSLKDSLFATFSFQTESDSIEYQIPIRNEGIIQNKIIATTNTKIQETQNLGEKVGEIETEIVLSRIPDEILKTTLEQLISYPYGCSEQITSSLYAAYLLTSLQKKMKWESIYLSGDTIILPGEKEGVYTMQELIDKTIQIYEKRQNANGLIGLRDSESESAQVSLYIYETIQEISKTYKVSKTFIKNLEKGINTITTPSDVLYKMMIESKNSSISQSKSKEFITTQKDLASKVMLYTIDSNQGINNQELLKEIQEVLQIPNSFQYNPQNRLFSRPVLLAYTIKGLLNNKENEKAYQNLVELLKGYNPIESWNTHEKIRIAQVLTEYFTRIPENSTDVSAKLEINGQSLTLQLAKGETRASKHLVIKNTDNIRITGQKDKTSTLTIHTQRIGKKPQDNEEHNTELKTDILTKETNNAEIGKILPTSSIFTTKHDANDMAVTITIPSRAYITNDYKNQQTSQRREQNTKVGSLNFTSKGGSNTRFSCTPEYYEIRFDRLFLFYKHLPAGASCEVAYTLIKSHQGTTPFLVHKLFEMYDTETRGTYYDK